MTADRIDAAMQAYDYRETAVHAADLVAHALRIRPDLLADFPAAEDAVRDFVAAQDAYLGPVTS